MAHAQGQINKTSIYDNVYIGPLCLIGEPAENRATWPEQPFGVEIHNGAILCKLVTVDAGTIQNTIIGKRVMLMAHSHVGHDAIIGDDVTIACGAKIGGHCEVGKGSNIGLNAVIHPRVKIPQGCMIGASAVVTKHLELKPFCCYVGNPAKFLRWNHKAIEIAGLTPEQVTEIQNNWLNDSSFLAAKDKSPDLTFEEFLSNKINN